SQLRLSADYTPWRCLFRRPGLQSTSLGGVRCARAEPSDSTEGVARLPVALSVAAGAAELSARRSSPGETETAGVGDGADEKQRRTQKPVVAVGERPGRVGVVDAVDQLHRSEDHPS